MQHKTIVQREGCADHVMFSCRASFGAMTFKSRSHQAHMLSIIQIYSFKRASTAMHETAWGNDSNLGHGDCSRRRRKPEARDCTTADM